MKKTKLEVEGLASVFAVCPQLVMPMFISPFVKWPTRGLLLRMTDNPGNKRLPLIRLLYLLHLIYLFFDPFFFTCCIFSFFFSSVSLLLLLFLLLFTPSFLPCLPPALSLVVYANVEAAEVPAEEPVSRDRIQIVPQLTPAG